jgi:hypothetical protein
LCIRSCGGQAVEVEAVRALIDTAAGVGGSALRWVGGAVGLVEVAVGAGEEVGSAVLGVVRLGAVVRAGVGDRSPS